MHIFEPFLKAIANSKEQSTPHPEVSLLRSHHHRFNIAKCGRSVYIGLRILKVAIFNMPYEYFETYCRYFISCILLYFFICIAQIIIHKYNLNNKIKSFDFALNCCYVFERYSRKINSFRNNLLIFEIFILGYRYD